MGVRIRKIANSLPRKQGETPAESTSFYALLTKIICGWSNEFERVPDARLEKD